MKAKGIDFRCKSNVSPQSWLLFCLGIVVIKFVLFALDPLPKFYGGDSKNYLQTAISGWIPENQSFVYGYIIRWVALSSSSLTSLLILQVFAGAIIAVVSAWICVRIFKLPGAISFMVGLLCCLDPIQLYWERAVMTETLSLMFYVLLLQRSFIYITTRRVRDLIFIQFLGLIVISFRLSYVILVYVTTVALPIIAFWPWQCHRSTESSVWTSIRTSSPYNISRAVGHWLLSVALILTLHSSYQHLNGFLSHREPGYLYLTGIELLSFWAPALKPSDAPDERLSNVIRTGDTFSIKQINSRPNQLYSKGFLIDRLYQLEPDQIRAEVIARQTAIRAFKRNPLTIASIAWQTYIEFWRHGIKTWAKLDIPELGQFSDVEVARLGLVDRFHQAVIPMEMKQPVTLNTWYYLAADWYYYLVLLSPVMLATLTVLESAARRYFMFLFFNQTALFATVCALCVNPQVRYLQPLSLITLLTFGAGVSLFIERKRHLFWRIEQGGLHA